MRYINEKYKYERGDFMNNQLDDRKLLLLLIHASAFFLPFLLPLLVYFFSKDFLVKRTALQATLFGLLILLALGVSSVLILVGIGLILLPLVAIFQYVVPIIGIVKVLQGEEFEYPIVKNWVK